MQGSKNVLILAVLLALTGCVSSGRVQHAGPVTTGIPVSLDFALVETTATPGDLDAETRLLNESIISDLRGHAIFDEVDAAIPAGDTGPVNGVKIKVVVKDIKKISNNERAWAGALAGRARIVAEVTVSDLSSGKLIETFGAMGESSGGSNLAGTTDEAVQRVAEQIVGQIIKISRLTSP